MECAPRFAPPTNSGQGCLPFGGLPSDSEFHGEALSFSSLPTSQFALKPSTSDLSGDAQCDYLEQLSRSQHRKLIGDSRTPGGSPNPSTPSSADGRSTPGFSMPPQMSSFHPPTSSSSASFQMHTKQHHDPSRASLSVADSKTIILTSAKQQPLPQPPKSKVDTPVAPFTPPPSSHPSPAPFTHPTPAPPKDSLKTHLPPEDSSIRTHPSSSPFSSLNGPSHCILKLNSPQWVADISRTGSSSKATCKITVETALLITSQLMEHAEAVKKEDGGQATKAPPTPTQRDPAPPPPPTQLTSPPPPRVENILPNATEKRGVVSLQQNSRRTVPSNGSSFPELFHSATRRLSETERGLKQALAG